MTGITVPRIQRIPEIVVPGKPLGRHINLDAREAARPYAGPRRTLVSVSWRRYTPLLDQLQVGACTGNAMTGALGSAPLFATLPPGHPVLDEAEALMLYSAAEKLDGGQGYPPEDNGSSGPSVARAAQNAGLIADALHYTDLDSALQALMQGACIFGFNWYDSFDNPDPDGTVSIAPGAVVRGGHEVLARIVDVQAQMVGFDNSWGTSWGAGGSFKMSFATLGRLLSEQGDCTAPEPRAKPTPTPTPAPTPPFGLMGWLLGLWHRLFG